MTLISVHEGLTEAFPAVPRSVGIIRHLVTDYARAAGFAGGDLDAVRIAVSEAASNAVRHAYPVETGAVYVDAAFAEDELWVLIADDGCGPSGLSNNPGLGWGLAVITASTHEFTLLERAEGGTEARMSFRLGSHRD